MTKEEMMPSALTHHLTTQSLWDACVNHELHKAKGSLGRRKEGASYPILPHRHRQSQTF